MSAVAVEEHERIRILRLNRPEARNAMDTALLVELRAALADAAADDDVRAVVLAGSGGTFSAGADLREVLDRSGQVRRMELFSAVYEAVALCPRPTVAAVSGHCVGGGAEVAAACDVRVADLSASFRFPGAALGFPVGAAKLVGLVGLGTAKDLVLTSRTIDAAEAHRVGLVQRVVPVGTAEEAARTVAGQIAANNAETVAYLKRAFDRYSGTEARVRDENDALVRLTASGGDYEVLADDR